MTERSVKTIDCQGLYEASQRGPIDLIDVRTPEEFADARADAGPQCAVGWV